jgi:hypothetical protein
MTWNQAHNLITQKIVQGIKLDPQSKYRFITKIPPYKCSLKKYNSAEGFKIQIGETTFIDIPITMLQTIFEDATINGGVYNKNIFRLHYPTQAEKNGHPCHVHVVGKIFEVAGVAVPNGRGYKIL